jgi:hypothetical protein
MGLARDHRGVLVRTSVLVLCTMVLACGRVGYLSGSPPGASDAAFRDGGDGGRAVEGGTADASRPRCTLGEGALATSLPACSVLPPPTGSVLCLTPDDAPDLATRIAEAPAGTAVLLQDGVYPLSEPIVFERAGVSLRSASRDPEAVVLDARGEVSEPLTIAASNVTLAAITLRAAATPGQAIVVTGSASGSTSGARIHNMRVRETAATAVFIRPSGEAFADDGAVTCSSFELSDAVRTTEAGCVNPRAIHGLAARGWELRGNEIRSYWCLGGGFPRAVLFSEGSRDLLVERNVLVDPFIGIGIGADVSVGRTYTDAPCGAPVPGVIDAIVRNNFVFGRSVQPHFDTGIAVWRSCNVDVAHNTVIALSGTDPFNAIEWRYPETQRVRVTNNLVNVRAFARDGATATEAGTVRITDAEAAGYFTDLLGGDLHLTSAATAALDSGVDARDVVAEDIDGDAREASPDVGADER